MRLEICIKIQVRQNFGIAAKNHLPDQALHFYWAKGQFVMWSDGVEHVRMAGGQGHTQHFLKVGFLTTVLSLPN